MAEVLTFIIMLINLLLSMWNAYATGYNSVILEKAKNMKFRDFFTIANSFGLVMAFAGAAYSLSYFLSLIASSLGYVSNDVVALISAYSFLVFGGLITFTGIVIAIESIIVAYYNRNFVSIAVAIYNVVVSVWNLYNYITAFSYARDIASSYGESEDTRVKALIIIAIAVLIAVFLVYAFYKMGKKKAEENL